MKVGDLVRCKHVDGKPLGIILRVRGRNNGKKVCNVDVLVNGHVWPFRAHNVEPVK